MRYAAQSVGGLLLATGVAYLGFWVDRVEFWSLFLAFTASFAGYLLCVYRPVAGRLVYWVALGIFLRVALVFAFPRLSDDVYRFIWDGNLVVAGQNPVASTPAAILQSGNAPAGNTEELYGLLNSGEYHSIYPPVSQIVFATGAWVGAGDWFLSSTVMKVFLLLAELGSLWLLAKILAGFGLPPSRLLLYWLNPLVIVEVMGNLHFEGVMVCFLLWSLYLLTRSRYLAAGGAMAVSIAAKLLPLMLLPFLLGRLWRTPFWKFFLSLGGMLLLLFLPLLLGSGFLDGFGGSLDLYFRKFEFNASLYYLLRTYGFYELGWNQIARFGPLLARIAGGAILIVALADRTSDWRSLPGLWLSAFVIYLLCATTVHPWYLTVPVALCCFTSWRFPLLWSYLIMLTYTSYTSVPYEENLWLVGVEYVLVGCFYFTERYRIKKERSVLSYGPPL